MNQRMLDFYGDALEGVARVVAAREMKRDKNGIACCSFFDPITAKGYVCTVGKREAAIKEVKRYEADGLDNDDRYRSILRFCKCKADVFILGAAFIRVMEDIDESVIDALLIAYSNAEY